MISGEAKLPLAPTPAAAVTVRGPYTVRSYSGKLSEPDAHTKRTEGSLAHHQQPPQQFTSPQFYPQDTAPGFTAATAAREVRLLPPGPPQTAAPGGVPLPCPPPELTERRPPGGGDPHRPTTGRSLRGHTWRRTALITKPTSRAPVCRLT